MGTLSIVSTPIGNLDDITRRAIAVLSAADVILCEDTRRTGLLLQHLAIETKTLMSFYDEIEEKRIGEVLDLLLNGKNVALVSDAGTPLISDPGYSLVEACIERGIPVQSIPGASSVLAALTSSGLPTHAFRFIGFIHTKDFRSFRPGETTIFFCPPHKLIQTLTDMKSALGDVPIVVARELTKIHEELWRGTISEAIRHFTNPKGECIVLGFLKG